MRIAVTREVSSAPSGCSTPVSRWRPSSTFPGCSKPKARWPSAAWCSTRRS